MIKYNNTFRTGDEVTEHLSKNWWEQVNRELISKALGEFIHELLLEPFCIKTHYNYATYALVSDALNVTYEFDAKKYKLDHWVINPASITKKHKGKIQCIDALKFILDFRETLGISDEMLPTYLEEISSTLYSKSYKYNNEELDVEALVESGFQTIEHAMTEGHPCFVANAGRIGFSSADYMQYAPETDNPFQLVWLAGHKNKTTFTSIKAINYDVLLQIELGDYKLAKFKIKLENLGLNTEDYIYIPVHPWQWHNKITHVFAADIAQQNLIYLGEGDDFHSAQQSIRTLFNWSHPKKMYTKTALSILNMGFMRGLSPYYMKSTPPITEWITNILKNDDYLNTTGFTMLGEVATVGFENTYYSSLGKSNAHNKMLSALWRESPLSKINDNQKLLTMAALLHKDKSGKSLLVALITASAVSPEEWLAHYLYAYLSPLLHCFYKYELVFMPHGENVIMVIEEGLPVHILMKDITEEVIVFNTDLELPDAVKRLCVKTDDKMKVLSLFTDVFDSFFRFMAAILEEHLEFSENIFWKLVAECIKYYQEKHPEFKDKYNRFDLFKPEFERCCLNRLQLNNTKHMLNLSDPINSLQLVGVLRNPIAIYKTKN